MTAAALRLSRLRIYLAAKEPVLDSVVERINFGSHEGKDEKSSKLGVQVGLNLGG
jgi:hypothetical protein